MKKQLLVLTLTFLTSNVLATPAISTNWKDVTNLSHKQCISKAEKVSKNSGYKGELIISENMTVKGAGKYTIAIRCGKIGKSRFAFFIVSGGKRYGEVDKILTNIVKKF